LGFGLTFGIREEKEVCVPREVERGSRKKGKEKDA
jgi:hypothetical protein